MWIWYVWCLDKLCIGFIILFGGGSGIPEFTSSLTKRGAWSRKVRQIRGMVDSDILINYALDSSSSLIGGGGVPEFKSSLTDARELGLEWWDKRDMEDGGRWRLDPTLKSKDQIEQKNWVLWERFMFQRLSLISGMNKSKTTAPQIFEEFYVIGDTSPTVHLSRYNPSIR